MHRLNYNEKLKTIVGTNIVKAITEETVLTIYKNERMINIKITLQ